MDEQELREVFLKSCNVLNDMGKGLSEIIKKIDKITGDVGELNEEEISKEIDEVISEYLNSLTSANDIIEVLNFRIKDLENFANIVTDMDINFEKLDDISEMIKETETHVNEMVTETTKWKNKGGKMKSYEDKRRGLKKNLDALDFEEGLGTQSKKLDDTIKYLEKKVKQNKQILACME